MRPLRSCCLVVVLAACANDTPDDTATSDTVSGATPLAASLADYAGDWTMQTMGTDSDSVRLTFTMTGSADTAGWSFTFPNRPTPVPVRIVSAEGDNVVTEAGPYESQFRPGTQVWTRATTRIDGDTLRGDVVATYLTAAGDSVVNLRTVGTRAR